MTARVRRHCGFESRIDAGRPRTSTVTGRAPACSATPAVAAKLKADDNFGASSSAGAAGCALQLAGDTVREQRDVQRGGAAAHRHGVLGAM
jgi:hypothetical protein